MRFSWKTLVAAVAGLLVMPQLAAADDVQEQLRQMQERMQQLEDRLTATNDQLEQANDRVADQQEMIERAGLDEDRSAISALSKFLNMTSFTGLAAASWNWNFAHPQTPALGARGGTFGGESSGNLGLTAPFHSNHNNFQVDQVKFGMEKPSTPESRAGFAADVFFGASADIQRGDADDATGDSAYLHQAYVSYLANMGSGVLVKAGRYETLLGAEVFTQSDNFNVTRGLVWTLQPVNHTGIVMSGETGGGMYWAVGAANDATNTQTDTNNDKALLGQLGWGNDSVSATLNYMLDFGGTGFVTGLTGQPANNDKGFVSYVDTVLTWDPSENLSTWLNYDWIQQDNDDFPSFDIHAVAVAGRYAINDQTGISTRFEYVHGRNVCTDAGGISAAVCGTSDVNLYSVTWTLDHALTDHLTVRGEYRWDRGSAVGSATDNFFVSEPGLFDKDNQHLALVEAIYSF